VLLLCCAVLRSLLGVSVLAQITTALLGLYRMDPCLWSYFLFLARAASRQHGAKKKKTLPLPPQTDRKGVRWRIHPQRAPCQQVLSFHFEHFMTEGIMV
jgi:hypothetical protein